VGRLRGGFRPDAPARVTFARLRPASVAKGDLNRAMARMCDNICRVYAEYNILDVLGSAGRITVTGQVFMDFGLASKARPEMTTFQRFSAFCSLLRAQGPAGRLDRPETVSAQINGPVLDDSRALDPFAGGKDPVNPVYSGSMSRTASPLCRCSASRG
jgi:hypothetical protein